MCVIYLKTLVFWKVLCYEKNTKKNMEIIFLNIQMLKILCVENSCVSTLWKKSNTYLYYRLTCTWSLVAIKLTYTESSSSKKKKRRVKQVYVKNPRLFNENLVMKSLLALKLYICVQPVLSLIHMIIKGNRYFFYS